MYEGALITANAVSGYLAGGRDRLRRLALGLRRRGGGRRHRLAHRGLAGLPGDPEPPSAQCPASGGGSTAAGVPGARAARLSLLAIYLVVFGLAFVWAGAITTLAPLYGGQALGLSAAAIGRALAIGYVVEAFLLIPVGWAADTFGRLRVLLPGLAVLLAGVLLLPLSGGLTAYTLACGLVIVGMTVWMIPASLLAEHLHGRFGGRAVGIYRFVTDLGMVAAPITVGWLIGRSGFAAGAGAIAVVLAGSGGVVALVLGARRRRSPR